MARAIEKFAGPGPLYRQVKEHILAQIQGGEWPPGFKVPSENQLVREFTISRMTANRAVRELMHEGYLSRIHGVGTFVNELPHQASLIELKNIAEEIRDRGHSHSADVISMAAVSLSSGLATQFGLNEGDEVFHGLVVHKENGTPVQIEDRYVNPAVAPEFLSRDFTAITPTEYLLSVAPVGELEHVVQACLPTLRQQELLEIDMHDPCLVLHRRSWSWGKVASVVTLTYPASRYELRGRYQTSPMGTLTAENTPNKSQISAIDPPFQEAG